jgi:hypothetical protein
MHIAIQKRAGGAQPHREAPPALAVTRDPGSVLARARLPAGEATANAVRCGIGTKHGRLGAVVLALIASVSMRCSDDSERGRHVGSGDKIDASPEWTPDGGDPRPMDSGAQIQPPEGGVRMPSVPASEAGPPEQGSVGPRITAVDLSSVAPGGILIVTTDAQSASEIAHVHVGSAAVSVVEHENFRWLDEDPQIRFAVRIPNTTEPGMAGIQLEGPMGMSLPHSVMVVPPQSAVPSAFSGIPLPPNRFGDDDPFPIGTTSPFQAVPEPVDGEPTRWAYDLSFVPQTSEQTESDAGVTECFRGGSITGTELHCPSNSGCAYETGARCPDDALACNPLVGTFRVNEAENRVDMFIDRGDPDGPEHVVGGWMSEDGAPATQGYAWLVLRSQRTGLQFGIRHLLMGNCHTRSAE